MIPIIDDMTNEEAILMIDEIIENIKRDPRLFMRGNGKTMLTLNMLIPRIVALEKAKEALKKNC